jgi:hypothetical protein
MENEFVTYEQAIILNKLGYDGDYNYTYDIKKELWYGDIKADGVKYIAAPLKQQVLRWFREKYKKYANLFSWLHEEEIGKYHEFEIYEQDEYAYGSDKFKTYEEAENACIDKLIELVKNK